MGEFSFTGTVADKRAFRYLKAVETQIDITQIAHVTSSEQAEEMRPLRIAVDEHPFDNFCYVLSCELHNRRTSSRSMPHSEYFPAARNTGGFRLRRVRGGWRGGRRGG